ATGSGPDGITAGGFARGGKLDLAGANSNDNTVSILPGNGDGTVRPPGPYPVGRTSYPAPSAVGAGDLSGTGILRRAGTHGQDGSLTILMGHGDGTFQPLVTYPYVVGGGSAIAVGDFNGDGKLDLALPDDLSQYVAILVGNGDGTFQTPDYVVVAGASGF